jgi:hypothetical protein
MTLGCPAQEDDGRFTLARARQRQRHIGGALRA